MTVVCCGFSIFQPLYTQVDNYMVSLILNRCYDSDNYCMFLNPVLCWIVGKMQEVLPGADSYTFLSRLLISAGIWCISYYIAKMIPRMRERLAACLILFLFVINASLFYDYFTLWSAFYMFVGMVLLLPSYKKNLHWGWGVVGACWIFFGIMWRVESAMIFLPFIVLDICMQYLKDKKFLFDSKKCRIGLCLLILCVGGLLFIDYGFKHSQLYGESVRYNDTVSVAFDYPMKDYEEVKEELPGISENDYYSLCERLYADTERITVEYGEKIVNIGSYRKLSTNLEGFLQANQSMLQTFFNSKKTLFNYAILLVFLIWIWVSAACWYDKVELLLAYVGAYFILLYFIYIGRAPIRIFNTVAYALIGMVLLLYHSDSWNNSWIDLKWWKWGMGFGIAFLVCMDTISYGFVCPQNVFRVRDGIDESRWEATYQEDNIYIWDMWAFDGGPMRDFMDQGKLMSDEFLKHNITHGEWTYGQVYYKNYLKKLGIPNPMEALLKRERTYYVSEDCTMVLVYLQEHFEKRAQVQEVGKVDGIPIWQFFVSLDNFST